MHVLELKYMHDMIIVVLILENPLKRSSELFKILNLDEYYPWAFFTPSQA